MNKHYAISLFGSPRALADALGITPHAIYQWGQYVPPLRVYQIRELRPDVFGPAPAAGEVSA